MSCSFVFAGQSNQIHDSEELQFELKHCADPPAVPLVRRHELNTIKTKSANEGAQTL